ncbi:MAG: hypothetical protein P4N59_11530 [Negativicutes bacterium]|nr:hypothetical protein [Negativicutes bacterium]
MAVVNYYLGLARGQLGNPFVAVSGTASNGTGSDVELRIQINNGTNATGITKNDVLRAMEKFAEYLEAGGPNHAGTNLPAL